MQLAGLAVTLGESVTGQHVTAEAWDITVHYCDFRYCTRRRHSIYVKMVFFLQ